MNDPGTPRRLFTFRLNPLFVNLADPFPGERDLGGMEGDSTLLLHPFDKRFVRPVDAVISAEMVELDVVRSERYS